MKRNALICLLAFGLTVTAHAAPADPTRPPLLPAPKATRPGAASGLTLPAPMPPLELSSTLLGGREAVAIINGQPLGQGESIQGLRVRQIGPGWVRLQGPGNSLLLKVPGLQYRPRLVPDEKNMTTRLTRATRAYD